MPLSRTRRNWERFGRQNPLWAILADPTRADRPWAIDEFFETGRREVSQNLRDLERIGVTIERNRCLDFGCGVGRLTQALCEHFAECDGVDIAASMIARAKRLNRHSERCRYHENTAPDLRLFRDRSFDFVISIITLQHMEPADSKRYIAEFIRVLRSHGVAVFQLTAARRIPAQQSLGPFNAEIIAADVPPTMPSGAVATLRVRVRNPGPTAWSEEETIPVVWAWNPKRPARSIERRTNLNVRLEPGAETVVPVQIKVPWWPGAYDFELAFVPPASAASSPSSRPTTRARTVVKPNPRLFARRIVPAIARRTTGLLRRTRTALRLALARQPEMDMYWIPREEVVEVLAAAGADVVDISPYESAGPDYESFRYIAIRR